MSARRLDFLREIEMFLELPVWQGWRFYSLKKIVDTDEPYWAAYIAYDDGGDPRGLTITTRGFSPDEALEGLLKVVREANPRGVNTIDLEDE